MAGDRAKHVRLDDMAGGWAGGDGDGEQGGKTLLLYVDPGGAVVAAMAARGARMNDLLAIKVEVYTLTDRVAGVALAAAVEAAAHRPAWACEPGEGCDGGGCERPSLTAREREVLRLVARGLTNEAVAVTLRISERTVRFHLTHIYGRLGASGRSEAIAWAVRRGLA